MRHHRVLCLGLVRDVITVSVDAMHTKVSNFDARAELSEGGEQTRAISHQEVDRVGA